MGYECPPARRSRAGSDGQSGEAAQHQAVTVSPVELAAGQRQAHLGESVEETAEGEATLEAGQRRAEAEVDAVAESQVTIPSSGQVELVGSVDVVGVTVGGGQVDDDLGAGRDGGVTDLERLGGPAEGRVGDGRVVADELLDGAGPDVRVGPEPAELVGVGEQRHHGVADEAGGGVVTGDDELEDGGAQLLLGEPVVAVAGVDEGADQGVVGLVSLLVDQLLDGADHLVRGGGGLGQLVGGAGRHEHGAQGPAETGSGRFGHPQQLADDLEGQREGVGGDQIDHCVGAGGGDGVEVLVDQAAHPGLEGLHSTHREGARHQPSQAGVIRRVDGQHVPGVRRARQPFGHHRSGSGQGSVHVLGHTGIV